MTPRSAVEELVADFLDNAKVDALSDDGSEFVIEFADGRTYLITAEEMR